jgi:hypothetical protein
MGFIFLKTVHTRFHVDETTLLSFFINSLPFHKKILRDNSFIKNETPIGSSLRTNFSELSILFMGSKHKCCLDYVV